MRIIAGVAKGRRLVVPPGSGVRPTADRVREALFSALQPHLAGAAVLDLYAGSGALGLEAASRGASRVTFVERDRRAVASIRANVAALDLPAATTVVARDAVSAVDAALLEGAPFDVVVADPPYAIDDATVAHLLAGVVAHVAVGAIVVLERAARSAAPTWPAALHPHEPRRYGDTVIHRAVHGAAPGSTGRREEPR